MKKILVSDYDGTFYLNDQDIANNIKLLNTYKDDIELIIATGRSYYDYKKKKDRYKINSKFIIINHGASILLNDKLIYNIEIANCIKEKIINEINFDKVVNYFCCSGKDSRLDINESGLTKIHIKFESVDYACALYKKVMEKYSDYINCYFVSEKRALEIVSSLANKKDAILKIADLENIKKENVFTVGDNDTDYNMLKHFNGYIMKKSSKKWAF